MARNNLFFYLHKIFFREGAFDKLSAGQFEITTTTNFDDIVVKH